MSTPRNDQPVEIPDDIDDVDVHSISCMCDNCVEGLILELLEERAS